MWEDAKKKKKKDEALEGKKRSQSNKQIFRFIGVRPLRGACLWGQVVRGVYLSVCRRGLRKRFTGCKTAKTSCLPVNSLITFFPPLPCPHSTISLAHKEPSLIGI